MNKDQKLLAEAYSRILKEANLDAMSPEERDAYEAELDKKEAYKAFLQGHNEEPTELDYTVDLEAIADFLNNNEVWSGSPARGSGGWYVDGGKVINDDAEGGYSGISVAFAPREEGLIASDIKAGKVVLPWPVSAQSLEKYMQSKSSRL